MRNGSHGVVWGARLAVGLAAALSLTTGGVSHADDECSLPSVDVSPPAATSGWLVVYGPGAYPVGYYGHTMVEVGECAGLYASGDASTTAGTAGGWTCKKRPWWRSGYYGCSGTFNHNGQTCYVEWIEHAKRVDGSPWDDADDEITYIECQPN